MVRKEVKHKVDIILPVYNVAPYLRRCLDSICNQTIPDWRAICINDGSTDNCAEILNEYAAKDDRFIVVHRENAGVSAARNAGFGLSESEFVMFVDPDDFIHPQTLEIALYLAGRDGSDIVSWYRDSNYRNRELRVVKALGKDPISYQPKGMSKRYDLDSIKSTVVEDFGAVCSDWRHPLPGKIIKHCFVWRHLFRREAIKDVKFMPRLKYEDVVWWGELMMKPLKATVTHLPLYYYYTNLSSITKSASNSEKEMQIYKGLSLVYDKYKENASPEMMYRWSHEIKWAVLFERAKKFGKTGGDNSGYVFKLLWDMKNKGMFDDAESVKEVWAWSKINEFLTMEPRPLIGSMFLKLRVYAAR